jgi:hypothetical protein
VLTPPYPCQLTWLWDIGVGGRLIEGWDAGAAGSLLEPAESHGGRSEAKDGEDELDVRNAGELANHDVLHENGGQGKG